MCAYTIYLFGVNSAVLTGSLTTSSIQLAERLQNKFGYMADQLLPALLRQTYVNIKVRLSVPLSLLSQPSCEDFRMLPFFKKPPRDLPLLQIIADSTSLCVRHIIKSIYFSKLFSRCVCCSNEVL